MKETLDKQWKGIPVKWWILGVIVVLFVVNILSGGDESSTEQAETKIEGTQGQTEAPAKAASEPKTPPSAPIIFSDNQASAFLLAANDFPKKWTAKKTGMFLDASLVEPPMTAKMIKITLATHETEAAAQTAFADKKAEAQTAIINRSISGDKLEDVKKYPLFIWNASSQANISGVEKWTVIGVYGNITVKLLNEGSMGAPKKSFAVDMAKKQMDKIMRD